MDAIKAMVRNGRIETERPLNFPEGTELEVRRFHAASDGDDDANLTPDDWDNSPEGIQEWLESHDSLHKSPSPSLFTPEEFKNWQIALKEQKEWALAHADERAEKLRRLFE